MEKMRATVFRGVNNIAMEEFPRWRALSGPVLRVTFLHADASPNYVMVANAQATVETIGETHEPRDL